MVLYGYDTVTEALVDQAEEVSGRGKQANFNWLFKGYGEGDLGAGAGGCGQADLMASVSPAFFF